MEKSAILMAIIANQNDHVVIHECLQTKLTSPFVEYWFNEIFKDVNILKNAKPSMGFGRMTC
jgi:hypothetical protein